MNLAITLIASLVPLLLAPGVPAESTAGALRLFYNSTDGIWVLLPQGRPTHVGKTVQAAYLVSRNSGGVCHANNIWFYCNSGDLIREYE